MDQPQPGYIYIIQLREHFQHKANVFKIGKTCNIMNRTRQYPKGSRLLYTHWVGNMTMAENALMQHLLHASKVVQRRDLGREYFEGVFSEVQIAAHNIATTYGTDVWVGHGLPVQDYEPTPMEMDTDQPASTSSVSPPNKK